MNNQKHHQDHYWQEDNHWSGKDNYSYDKHHDWDKDKCCKEDHGHDKDNYSPDKHHDWNKDKCCHKEDHGHDRDKYSSDKHHDWDKDKCCKDDHWHDKDKCSSDKHHDRDKDKCCHKDNHWHDKDKCSSDKHHDQDKDKCCKDDHGHDKDKCSSDKHHDGKKHRRCYDIYPGSPCCDDRFSLRLAGLEGGLNFRLRQLIGEEIELFVTTPVEKVITGVVVEVGGDYIEIKPSGLLNTLPAAQFPRETIMVLFEHIAKIIAPKAKKRKHPHHDYQQAEQETLLADAFPHKTGCLCAQCRAKRRKHYSKKKFL